MGLRRGFDSNIGVKGISMPDHPRIAITMGDPAGIGPEIIVKVPGKNVRIM